MRPVAVYALRGALSGLLCCSPGLCFALGGRGGVALWGLFFLWWAPAVTYGALVTAPLAIALKRSWVGGTVAFLASPLAYFVALWAKADPDSGVGEPNSWQRLCLAGAVGAAIVVAGNLPPPRGAGLAAAFLTVFAGASAALVFCLPDLFPASEFMGMVQITVEFMVWQSATAACLSLGLCGGSDPVIRQ
jgi:hypothetical protein